jgi:hypothetical protein
MEGMCGEEKYVEEVTAIKRINQKDHRDIINF